MRKLIERLEEQGRGMGPGGGGDGPGGKCKCPKCEYSMKHDTGKPCMEIECPKCGAKMGRVEEDRGIGGTEEGSYDRLEGRIEEESVGRFVMDKLIPMSDIRKIGKNSDEQTGKLAISVYMELLSRIDKALGREGNAALNRLSILSNFKKDTSGITRNNIFKAADELGVKLPSMMF